MSTSSTAALARALAVLLALSLGACAKKSGESTAPGADQERGGGLDDLEVALSAHESQLRALGFDVPGGGGLAAKKAEADTSPGRDVPAAGEPTGDSTENQAAPSMAGAEAAPTTAPAPRGRCETICQLSASICQLEDQICDLVPRHPNEPRYQLACDRAAGDCTFASEACNACA